jgi:hypothetical protein
MLFYLFIGLIWLGLAYLVLKRPKQALFLLLALLPFSAFLKTLIGHLCQLDAGQVVVLTLWKEMVISLLIILTIYQAIKRKGWPFKFSLVDYLILALLGLALLSYLFTGLSSQALLLGIKYDLLFLLFYLAVKSLGFNRQDLKKMLVIILITTVIVVIFSLAQVWLPAELFGLLGYADQKVWQPHQNIQSFQIVAGHTRIPGPLSGPNQLGVYLSFCQLLILGLLMMARKKKHQILLTTIFLVGLIPIFFSYSRSAWVGLLIGSMVATVVFIWQKLKNLSARKRAVTIMVSCLILLLVAISIWQIAPANWGEGVISRQTDLQRKSALIQSGQLLIDNPWGVGIGRVGPAAQWLTGIDQAIISENFYLQIGLELGFLGLIIFLLIMIQLIQKTYLGFQDGRDRLKRGFNLGLGLGLIGVLISGLFLHTLTDASLIFTVAILLGISQSLTDKPRQIG